ncbi:Ger(x)C family spore germination protein [Halobacillus naozhouensis]|uniref:Ger(X)C family spore germination protein n=1 Tax=Halobacillus naozhouensis TaxID=554880 RepID=A0ABY8J3F9_9BACI|nr:Ger(x)C family spore germination protein [Halobacillus naozhouensis]WFT75969.1 Ger(x)C family spore germination protein [Halobacillus naozhouensis]
MKYKILCVMLSLLVLTGCWDQRQFKNYNLALSVGFDQLEGGRIRETVSIPTIMGGPQGPREQKVQIVSSKAPTTLDAREKIDQKISASFDPSKIQVVLVGENLAKRDIYPVLDGFYRNPNSNLNAQLALVEGSAQEAISIKTPNEARVSQYLTGLLEGVVSGTYSTGENLQLISAELMEPGEDFSLPILKVEGDKQMIKYNGLALFNNRSYTGEKIKPEDAVLFILLQGQKGKRARITRKVNNDKENEPLNYVTIKVMKIKRDLKVTVQNGEVKADLSLKISARVLEYPHNQLVSLKIVKNLSERLTRVLTKDAKEIIAKTQASNSDVFSIGRRVKGYYPEVWKQLDWIKAYPQITITPKVEVDVKQHGIIN